MHWRETSLITAAGVMKRIKETAVVVTDPERDPSEPSRVMPANEGTSTDNFAVARIKLERMNPLAGFPPKMSRSNDSSTDSSTTPILSSFIASTEERKAVEKGDFRSIPCRNVHEKLFRDFFELVLQRAVFQVNVIFNYVFICLNEKLIPVRDCILSILCKQKCLRMVRNAQEYAQMF